MSSSKIKRTFRVIFLLSILISLKCKPIDLNVQNVNTILMDADYLAGTKSRIEKNDPQLWHAY